MTTRNFRATVEYDGTAYHGFQIQVCHPTIQGELERALERVTREFVRVNGAGRTDAGVHARGQVISFRSSWSHDCSELQRAMNANLPGAIAVREVALAAEGFHARFSATSRSYIYRIYCSPVRSPLLDRFAHRLFQPVQIEAMEEAAEKLPGWHDLAAFGQPPSGENTVRLVHRATWRRVAADSGCFDKMPTELLQFEIEANAFLRGMVRRVVGTLVLVGIGALSVTEFNDILLSRDISRAGPPAPACGLCLKSVRYE
ncbi:MAG: tRNA pseudouridine(38-40) synthase TruA [Chloroflexi bacterium]|nr:tRNA pseudouridine(38-40) synthase TruA [Chloroflexota bacterium]